MAKNFQYLDLMNAFLFAAVMENSEVDSETEGVKEEQETGGRVYDYAGDAGRTEGSRKKIIKTSLHIERYMLLYKHSIYLLFIRQICHLRVIQNIQKIYA